MILATIVSLYRSILVLKIVDGKVKGHPSDSMQGMPGRDLEPHIRPLLFQITSPPPHGWRLSVGGGGDWSRFEKENMSVPKVNPFYCHFFSRFVTQVVIDVHHLHCHLLNA